MGGLAQTPGIEASEDQAMRNSKFTNEQIVQALRHAESGTPRAARRERHAESGTPVADICRKLQVTETTFYYGRRSSPGWTSRSARIATVA